MIVAPRDRTYQEYKEIFKGREMPFAFVDLDLFDANAGNIAGRAGSKKLRIASKSIRCTSLIRRILDSSDTYQGVMCFTGYEALHLSSQGLDDLLVAYPIWHEEQVSGVCRAIAEGKKIILMIDSVEHVNHLQTIAATAGVQLPVCIDLDMSSDYPGLHFGVRRSPVTTPEEAVRISKAVTEAENLVLDGLMGYEAQIAGLQDTVPGKAGMNALIRFLKKRSIREIRERRAQVVDAIGGAGTQLRFVNGGGTGSLESTREEDRVTEVTAGSGFYAPGLFDHFTNFKHLPSAGYAIEITRIPKEGIYTCHGGGYIASGAAGPDKLPKPYLPEGARLLGTEGAGEVQTPIVYDGPEKLSLGDPVFLRHSKAGEICERFKTFLLVQDGEIQEEIPTYRGEGLCFV